MEEQGVFGNGGSRTAEGACGRRAVVDVAGARKRRLRRAEQKGSCTSQGRRSGELAGSPVNQACRGDASFVPLSSGSRGDGNGAQGVLGGGV